MHTDKHCIHITHVHTHYSASLYQGEAHGGATLMVAQICVLLSHLGLLGCKSTLSWRGGYIGGGGGGGRGIHRHITICTANMYEYSSGCCTVRHTPFHSLSSAHLVTDVLEALSCHHK